MDKNQTNSYDKIQKDFVADVLSAFSQTTTEISNRNDTIKELDNAIYGKGLSQRLRLPMGHDITEVNWLRRVVEIHTDQFMGNGFQIASSYDSKDEGTDDEDQKKRIRTENKIAKEYADQRRNLIQDIIDDNGGVVLFKELAANASAVGFSVIKSYYDKKEKKWEICQVESVENFHVLWSDDDFREYDAVAYVDQMSLTSAIKHYNVPSTTPTSPIGQPLVLTQTTNQPNDYVSSQKMVSKIEVTGVIPEWGVEKGRLKRVKAGQETELNALIIGDRVVRLISNKADMPRYYILPNKRHRRRAWGVSDVTDAAVDINLTYIETLSDWRTVASKVNFPKFKVMGVGQDVQLPKPRPRVVEMIPLSEGQDIDIINQGDANQIDFTAQLEELKEQFVRETGLSRVLFSDPTITLNSNQALMTSMKPTTDIAVAKKALWAPILVEMFTDILETLALHDETVKDLVNAEDGWYLKVIWPDYSAKYDPSASSMLINRFNANLISIQSYMEQMGESKEEIDRIMDELANPATAAIAAKQLPVLVQGMLQQAPAPQPTAGGGQQPLINTPANNTPGSGIISQPGSGATSTSPEGAVAQTAQQGGA